MDVCVIALVDGSDTIKRWMCDRPGRWLRQDHSTVECSDAKQDADANQSVEESALTALLPVAVVVVVVVVCCCLAAACHLRCRT